MGLGRQGQLGPGIPGTPGTPGQDLESVEVGLQQLHVLGLGVQLSPDLGQISTRLRTVSVPWTLKLPLQV